MTAQPNIKYKLGNITYSVIVGHEKTFVSEFYKDLACGLVITRVQSNGSIELKRIDGTPVNLELYDHWPVFYIYAGYLYWESPKAITKPQNRLNLIFNDIE